MFLMEPASTDLWAMWRNVVATAQSRGHFDAIFEDNTDDLFDITSSPCGVTSASWFNASKNEIVALGSPVIYNALAILGPNYSISGSISLNSVALAGLMETCYSQAGSSPKIGPAVWAATENTEIQMALDKQPMFCYGNNTSTAASAADLRTFVYASYLLTYDPQRTILWEHFANPSDFHVQPETELVALYPKVPEPSTIASLQVSGGVYAREYGACYVRGVNAGGCAAVVNPSPNRSYPFPYGPRYTHTLVLVGGGVLDGGTIRTNGPPPSGVIGPQESVIVFK
jgi:hypothetical protein